MAQSDDKVRASGWLGTIDFMGLSRRTVLLLVAAAIIAGFVVAVIWRIDSSSRPVDVATVYAADLAAVAIGITLLSGMWAWWRVGRVNGL